MSKKNLHRKCCSIMIMCFEMPGTLEFAFPNLLSINYRGFENPMTVPTIVYLFNKNRNTTFPLMYFECYRLRGINVVVFKNVFRAKNIEVSPLCFIYRFHHRT